MSKMALVYQRKIIWLSMNCMIQLSSVESLTVWDHTSLGFLQSNELYELSEPSG